MSAGVRERGGWQEYCAYTWTKRDMEIKREPDNLTNGNSAIPRATTIRRHYATCANARIRGRKSFSAADIGYRYHGHDQITGKLADMRGMVEELEDEEVSSERTAVSSGTRNGYSARVASSAEDSHLETAHTAQCDGRGGIELSIISHLASHRIPHLTGANSKSGINARLDIIASSDTADRHKG
ncbi:uncharacterized protein MYCGRDRAFT_97933 [Zymoseptoria tritici IPO323]|uniref:Uncharacterized protein n=1 Tax=Zymoseptoria tritici (strain CBS 115943 / IPO323) TaxID=336722 RepID=F9XRU0_ZYMTI|nr:uncharacterized protein MYCGRDRAFT_97933 [Zymoseptoria tritici IPO323]EGP81973.1 hypothetical protein MYCGRDRAFT_97933 [Zymoseptoria tritici IPO323]